MATVFASATRTQAVGTYTSAFALPPQAEGLIFSLNISAIGTTPTLDITFEYLDSVTGTWNALKDSAGNTVGFTQKTGTGTDDLMIAPGCVEKLTGSNRRYAQSVPNQVRAKAVVGDAGGDTITFSLASATVGRA